MQAGHPRAQLPLAERLFHHHQQVIDLEGLGDVVERTQLDGADRGIDRAERRDGDDIGRRLAGLDLAEHVQAIQIGHLHVGHHQIDATAPDSLEALAPAARGLDLETTFVEGLPQQFEHGPVVFHDQNASPRLTVGVAARHGFRDRVQPCKSCRSSLPGQAPG